MTEIWREIADAPNYEVSSYGRVRRVAGYRCRATRILKPRPDSDGYLMPHFSVDGRKFNAKVHQLVCAAFHGPKPTVEHEVGHLDGCRTNNNASNLAWVTRSENAQHRSQHGNAGKSKKLTEEQVGYIRRSTMSGPKIAAELQVSSTQVYRIRNGESRLVDVETLTKEAKEQAA